MPYKTARKRNFHTHTERCGHAVGNVADYCRAAVDAGLEVLGISDHSPLPDGRWDHVRMKPEHFQDYCREIEAARREFDNLLILTAVECEHVDGYENYYRDFILGEQDVDYLIGAVHWYPLGDGWKETFGGTDCVRNIHAYTKHLIRTMETGLFAFIAHPDVYGNAYPEWDAEAKACALDIIQAAADLNMPLEINTNGIRKGCIQTSQGERYKYPWRPFWEIAADHGIKVIINSDAHKPKDVAAGLGEMLDVAEELGLQLMDTQELMASRLSASR